MLHAKIELGVVYEATAGMSSGSLGKENIVSSYICGKRSQ
jgi:hypothetical protein